MIRRISNLFAAPTYGLPWARPKVESNISANSELASLGSGHQVTPFSAGCTQEIQNEGGSPIAFDGELYACKKVRAQRAGQGLGLEGRTVEDGSGVVMPCFVSDGLALQDTVISHQSGSEPNITNEFVEASVINRWESRGQIPSVNTITPSSPECDRHDPVLQYLFTVALVIWPTAFALILAVLEMTNISPPVAIIVIILGLISMMATTPVLLCHQRTGLRTSLAIILIYAGLISAMLGLGTLVGEALRKLRSN